MVYDDDSYVTGSTDAYNQFNLMGHVRIEELSMLVNVLSLLTEALL